MVLKSKKRFLSMLLVAAVVSSVCRISTYQVISAKTTEAEKESSISMENEEETGNIQLAVITGDGKISMSPVIYSLMNSSGVVGGNGVRLRKGPSLTSTVLELMNKGELVIVYKKESKVSSGFYYVKRIKTGTKGYASIKYIDY